MAGISSVSGLYKALPVWAQNSGLTMYGYLLRHRRYGGGHREALAELERTQWLGAADLQALQLKALNQLLGVARQVPFYQGRSLPRGPVRSTDELQDVPLLGKDELQRAGTATIAPDQPRPLEIHTGGTTGKPLTVFCDRASLRRNYAFFERFKRWAGIGPKARVATFAGRMVVPPEASDPPFWRWNGAMRTTLFSSYHISPATLPAYVAELSRFKPDLIDSYPSSLVPLATYLLDQGIQTVRPRAIITSSETLVDADRALIEAAFGCRVFDHYGAAEMVAFITQCEAGSYHANPEYGIAEILTDGRPARPGESGDLVATGLINPIMPLIRYRTGDTAVFGDTSCACGRAFPIIAKIEGRRDDVLITPDGRRIGRLDPIFKSTQGLYETRIVQDAIDRVRIEGVVVGEFTAADEQDLVTQLQARMGPLVTVEFVRVPSIPRTSSGKFRAVVNNVKAPAAQEARR
jgi:phenylacetate-CoA ligase